MELSISSFWALSMFKAIWDRDCEICVRIEGIRKRKSRWIEISCHIVHYRAWKFNCKDSLPLINTPREITRLKQCLLDKRIDYETFIDIIFEKFTFIIHVGVEKVFKKIWQSFCIYLTSLSLSSKWNELVINTWK